MEFSFSLKIKTKKEEERNIYAVFDDKTIRVYQAYNNEIADEA